MSKKKLKEFKGYTEEQLSYFQFMNDQDDGMVDDIQDMNYMDYLVGDVQNNHHGTQDTMDYDEMDLTDHYLDD